MGSLFPIKKKKSVVLSVAHRKKKDTHSQIMVKQIHFSFNSTFNNIIKKLFITIL